MPRANLDRPTVVAAAADLADRDGLDAVTLSALARGFGVQPASMYTHVADRRALLDGVHELALGLLADRVADALAGRSRRAALAALAEAHRAFAEERPGCWAALHRQPAAATVAAAAARVADQLLAVLRGYELADDEAVHAARLVGATVDGFVTLTRSGQFAGRGTAIDVSWDRAVGALDAALASWPPAASA